MPVEANAQDFEKLNARLLRHFAALVHDLGGSLPDLLRQAGIGEEEFAGGSGALSYPQTIALLETSARALGCPDLGMRLARRQSGGSIFGPLGQVMRNSRTFGDALRFACKHSDAHSRAARMWVRALPDESAVFAAHELLVGSIANRAQVIEQVLLVGHLEAMEMTGGYARARCVHFRHEPVSDPGQYRRNFGCEVRFGEAVDGLTFSAADLDCPVLHQSSQIHREMAAYIERSFPRERLPVHAEVRGLIIRRLEQGDCSIGEVARAMNLHLRTLRRHLHRENTGFQEVKDQVRRELTQYYLERTNLDFRSISEKLGFAEQSILSRNCRRWFGRSPSQFRREAAGT
ncbi:AraC family transcriptional regulator [Novosphingobium beihaiensis]|uniref:AraC family transcriptional regulator n=1 Tax=Novosphingobium beihaiensis TaxID=2930389 RepID=A0ABT0BL17_9SPHN|nr:AraC family transcriptional regulator [Novosphingobium beihaiensis]MCJ2185734.1 AraC family transcriptional regulator [Novosphingobium beihaiensis]